LDDDAAVAEERVYTWLGGDVELEVGDLEAGVGFGGHLAVFTTQVADLAGCGLGGFTDGRVAALVGVEVAESGGTVTGGGDGVDVDLVDWWVGS
jgi:hypothetical protein